MKISEILINNEGPFMVYVKNFPPSSSEEIYVRSAGKNTTVHSTIISNLNCRLEFISINNNEIININSAISKSSNLNCIILDKSKILEYVIFRDDLSNIDNGLFVFDI